MIKVKIGHEGIIEIDPRRLSPKTKKILFEYGLKTWINDHAYKHKDRLVGASEARDKLYR